MSLLKRLVREPLVHFVFIGAAIFGLYALTGSQRQEPRDKIVVTDGRVQQLAQIFARTWQRPPTRAELNGLIDAFIKEEVYYREAIKLGLDRDDTIIRRRMQQKMEFLTEPGEGLLAAGDAELEAFLKDNRSAFAVEPRIAFEQVFIRPDKGPEPAASRAESALKSLRALAPDGDLSSIGDPSLLPLAMPLSPLSLIARDFGDDFARALVDLPKGEWTGPVESSFGLHLVRVSERADGYDPPLAEIRDAVRLKWQDRKRGDFQKAEYDRLRAKYDVVVPALDKLSPEKPGAAP
ncbi:MAG: peptidyl-prolyl cis-trans isomerase [Methyloceanibacter sp.]